MQILIQLYEMGTVLFYNSDDTMRIWIKHENRVRGTVNVANMVGDGSCLYRAMVHQLYKENKSTDHFKQTSRDLRLKISAHIEKNLKRYISDVKLTMTENIARYKNVNLKDITKKQCREYVEKEMIKDDNWGGGESLKAFSELYKTNILILMENSNHHHYYPKFEEKYVKTIILAFRLDCFKRKYNHYESVVSIDQNNLKDIIDDMNKVPLSDAIDFTDICMFR